MGLGLGITLLAVTLVVIGGYAFFCGLAVEKFEKTMTENMRNKT